MDGLNPQRRANLPPGYDEEDPYEDQDLESYPAWWRRNVAEFRAYGLRPYRPARFEDGAFTAAVVGELEAELGIEVRLRTVDPGVDRAWEVWVNGAFLERIDKRRDGGGYSEFGMESEAFRELVRSSVDVDGSR
ncbi:hypothetical protein HUG10_20055 (plasmid) [Halorarum halophilum]|uniref:Uncharacterized protein n=1 Tax=Halorarum halophilum TaxID=2743090 RepID=A0A7D5GPM6_9EURY|nr:hypothetical protein [Halobaculum halophilum]QLG29904.1 hypothetical protein HUG10_20055 [Halobaculum halophilum]